MSRWAQIEPAISSDGKGENIESPNRSGARGRNIPMRYIVIGNMAYFAKRRKSDPCARKL